LHVEVLLLLFGYVALLVVLILIVLVLRVFLLLALNFDLSLNDLLSRGVLNVLPYRLTVCFFGQINLYSFCLGPLSTWSSGKSIHIIHIVNFAFSCLIDNLSWILVNLLWRKYFEA
jgi:hypothetical protein